VAQRGAPLAGRNGGTLLPFRKGQSGNPAGVSPERRQLYQAIESHCIPQVLQVLDNLLSDYLEDGNMVAIKVWLDQVRGPIRPRDDDAIEAAVEERLGELIEQLRRQRAANPPETTGLAAPKEAGT
jgi:hypothetical protein